MEIVNSTNSTEEYSITIVVLISIACALWSAITIGGNALVIVAFFVNKKLHIAPNYYILSLAVADFIIGLFTINLFCVNVILHHWPLGDVSCNLWLLADYGGCQASVLSLVLICHDRYKAIQKMDLSWKNRIGQAKRAILIIWIISFTVWIPMIYVYPVVSGHRIQKRECLVVFLKHNGVITILTHFIGYFVPVIIIIIQYTRLYNLLGIREKQIYPSFRGKLEGNKAKTSKIIVRSVVRSNQTPENKNQSINKYDRNNLSSNEMPVTGTSESQNKEGVEFNDAIETLKGQSSKPLGIARVDVVFDKWRRLAIQRKILKVIFLVVTTYIACWTLYEIFAMIKPFCNSCINDSLWTFSYALTYVNSTLNPFCYTGANKEFRDTFKRLLLCRGKVPSRMNTNPTINSSTTKKEQKKDDNN